ESGRTDALAFVGERESANRSFPMPGNCRGDRFLQKRRPAGIGNVALPAVDPAETSWSNACDRGDEQAPGRCDRLFADCSRRQHGKRIFCRELKMREARRFTSDPTGCALGEGSIEKQTSVG